MNRRKLPLLVASIAAVLAISAGVYSLLDRNARLHGRTYRIGYRESPNRSTAGDGGPAGPVGELVAEAARRAGITLVWVQVKERPDDALTDGRVDLWPFVGIREERKGRIHMTEPWQATPYAIVTCGDRSAPSAGNLAASVLGLPDRRSALRVAQSFFPAAKLVRFPDSAHMFEALCAGGVDAVLYRGDPPGDGNQEPAHSCREKRLHFAYVPNAIVEYGIGASRQSPGAAAAADAIREQISILARDRTLSSLNFRWFVQASQDTLALDQVLQMKKNALILAGFAGCLIAALVLLAWQSLRLRKARAAAIDASQRAVKANRAKTAFFRHMSHEIRTPLNGLLGAASLLGETGLDAEQRHLQKTVAKSGEMLLNVINAVLDLSKIEAGRLELESLSIDPLTLICDVVEVMRPTAEGKRIGLRLEFPLMEPIYITGDPGRLQQVLLNLVGNAIKFTSQGEVVVRVETKETSGGRALLRIQVEDTGTGVAEDARTRLFQPFSQADASTTRRHGGTGLGLAISKALVEAMGGAIGFAPRPAGGSIFWFTIAAPVSDHAPVIEDLPETAVQPIQPLRVLVAEDNPVNQMIATKMLERMGCSIAVVDNGQAAVELLARDSFDLVLMDCFMPVLDGVEATRRIRETERSGHHTPIIGLTAASFVEDRERCLASGMDDFLGKPVTLRALSAAVSKWTPRPAC